MKQVNIQDNNTPDTIKKEEKKPAKPVNMKPLFSWTTVFILVLGLLVGLLVAIGYWLFSPSITGSSNSTQSDNTSTGLLGMLGMVPDGPYESRVSIQVVSPGSEYTPLSTLQQRAEYYSAKSLSLPFFEYLSQRLSDQMPGFSANVDRLGKMISSAYNARTELPVIKITVTAPTEAEAVALAELVPQDFSEYLISEQKDKIQKDYAATLGAIDTVKTALVQAQQELNTLKQQDIGSTDPDIIILKAKVDALQQVLNTQITQLSVQNVGDVQTEYNSTLEQLRLLISKIDDAKKELSSLQTSANTTTTDNSPRIILEAKVRALQTELDRATTAMIAIGDPTSAEYTTALKSVETTAKNLADAQKQLSELLAKTAQTVLSQDYQLAQIKLDTLNTQQTTLTTRLSQLSQQILNADTTDNQTNTQAQFNKTSLALAQAKTDLDALETQVGYDRLTTNLNLSIAQNKVSNLNARLLTLTQQLGSLVGGDINSLETDYLVAGSPSAAFPVLPTRAKAKTTLMVGGIAGIIIAWILWNWKWFIRQLKSLGGSKPEGVVKE
jgi:hypothetical protein